MFRRKKEAVNPVAQEIPATASAPQMDANLIAVITAAIAAFEGGSVSANGFIVRKISRATGINTSWSNAGLNECIDSRRF